MAGFANGFLLGGIVGTVFGLLTNKRSGPDNRAEVSDWVNGTKADLDHFQHATAAVQAAAHKLQELNTSTLQPTTVAIQQSIRDYEFRTAPHLAKMSDSMEHINDAVNDAKQPEQ